jgi:glycosyltransferase involved in cell wall biosynthesis
MRIAIVVAGLPPLYNGGAEIAAVEIARYAVIAGHEVHIVALDGTRRGSASYRYLQDGHGFTVHRIQSVSIPYLYALSAIPEAVTTILKIRPDTIHAQGIMVAPIAFVATMLVNIPWLLYGRGEIYTDWWLKSTAHKFFLNNANRVVAQTEDMKREMLKYCSREIEVIPNGIDGNRFGGTTKRDAREKLRLAQDRHIAIAIGRLRPEKNLKCFVDAAMLDRSGKIDYIIVGDGVQLGWLTEYAKEYIHIRFLGAVPNDQIPMWLCASDVLVNTSFSEGFPMSVLEGLASGLPIVAPIICGIPEIVENEVNGILTEPNNPESVYRAIDSLTKDMVKSREIPDNNREKAKRYDWETVVKKLYS